MKKYFILIISFFMLVASCGSKKDNTTENTKTEKVFNLSGISKGGDSKIGYFWQNGEGLMPYLLSRALVIPDYNFKNVEPDLAEDFKVLDDGKTYTMKLKKGLKWSDGEPLTTDDVRFSFETALKVSLLNGIFPENFLKIQGAREFKEGKAKHIKGLIINGNNITFKLIDKVGLFPQILGQFTLIPKHIFENENPLDLHNSELWTKPVTNGMYMVKTINPGNFIELEKNPYYEGKSPKIDSVMFRFINSPVISMQSGKSYFYSTNKLQEINQLKNIVGVTEFPVDLLFYRYFIVNLSGIEGKGNTLLNDVRAREAILYAINRKEIVDTLLKGLASVNNTGVPSNLSVDYLQGAKSYEYNPEKAKKLLKEAGYDFSRPLVLTYYYKDQTSNDIMQAISYQLSQVGIKNKVVQVQSDATSELFKIRKYDIALKGFSSFGYESWYGEYTSRNTNFKNIYNSDTSFDDLTRKLSTTVDSTKRKEILNKLQKLEQKKLFKLPLYTIKNFIFVNTDKVELPKGLQFGNPFYRFNYDFENWNIK